MLNRHDNMRTNCPFAWVLIFVAFLLPVSCGSAQSDPIPKDFELSAQYFPGYSTSKPWKVVITADGKVSQEIHVPRNGKESSTHKTFVLTTNELQQLWQTVRASAFATLKKDYSYSVTD